MIICYSKLSEPSANLIADELIEMGVDVELVRGSEGDINWGRANTNARLNPNTESATNKRVMRERFRDAENVPMPQLIDFPLARDTEFPIVGRSDYHRKGRGFWLCRNVADVLRSREGRTYRSGRRKEAATHYMEFIDAPREYRVHIFNDKSIRISEKIFNEDRSDYTTGKPRHEVKHVRKAAKRAVRALELDFGAVDVLANDTECWVLEVNSAPGLGGSMPRLYAEMFKKWEEENA